jgi:hypothetical protein
MSDFKDRLIVEKQDLDEKIGLLSAFQESNRFALISDDQQTLLNIQRKAMETYSQVLLERIVRLND